MLQYSLLCFCTYELIKHVIQELSGMGIYRSSKPGERSALEEMTLIYYTHDRIDKY